MATENSKDQKISDRLNQLDQLLNQIRSEEPQKKVTSEDALRIFRKSLKNPRINAIYQRLRDK